jgi:LPXTG-motif cell wall-anchored protein
MMKKVIGLIKFLILSALCWPLMVKAQDSIVYIEDPAVFDSTLLEQEFTMDPVAQSSGSDNTMIIVVAVLVVIAVAIYVFLKKRKKSGS